MLPRNWIALFADGTSELGMPLERESQPLPRCVSQARGGTFSGPRLWLEPELVFELLLFGWSMNLILLRSEGFIFQKCSLPSSFSEVPGSS